MLNRKGQHRGLVFMRRVRHTMADRDWLDGKLKIVTWIRHSLSANHHRTLDVLEYGQSRVGFRILRGFAMSSNED